MKKILYIVATQYDNMGDLLINKCLVDELAEHGMVYLDTHGVPDNFKKNLLNNRNVKELNAISKYSIKSWKGLLMIPFYSGFRFDYLFKSPGPFGGSVTFKERVHAWVFFYIFLVFRLRKTKSFLMGNDFILESAFDKFIVKLYDKALGSINVRSEKNVQELKNAGVRKVNYLPDLCYMMKVPEQVSLKIKVGISFRDMGEVANEKIKNAVKDFVNYFTKRNVEIEFFYQVERDKNFNQQLFSEVASSGVSFRERVLTWEERDYYKDKLLLFSNRLHVLLLGQVYEAIPLGLVFDQLHTNKIKNIFDSVGFGKQIRGEISINDLDTLFKNKNMLSDELKLINSQQKAIFKTRLYNIFSPL